MTYFDFDWDANKARVNLKKHQVPFRLTTSVFRDPLARTIYDTAHSDDEERWVTLGRAANGQVLVVVHTARRSARRSSASALFQHAVRTN